MKRNTLMLLLSAIVILASCGTASEFAGAGRFQDGIYYKATPQTEEYKPLTREELKALANERSMAGIGKVSCDTVKVLVVDYDPFGWRWDRSWWYGWDWRWNWRHSWMFAPGAYYGIGHYFPYSWGYGMYDPWYWDAFYPYTWYGIGSYAWCYDPWFYDPWMSPGYWHGPHYSHPAHGLGSDSRYVRRDLPQVAGGVRRGSVRSTAGSGISTRRSSTPASQTRYRTSSISVGSSYDYDNSSTLRRGGATQSSSDASIRRESSSYESGRSSSSYNSGFHSGGSYGGSSHSSGGGSFGGGGSHSGGGTRR